VQYPKILSKSDKLVVLYTVAYFYYNMISALMSFYIFDGFENNNNKDEWENMRFTLNQVRVSSH